MAGCSDDVIRDVEKDCGFTPEDVEVLMKKKRGFVEISNPDWKPPDTESQENPVKPEPSDTKKSREDTPDGKDAGAMDCKYFLSSGSSDDKKETKKSSASLRKASARERVVCEVKAVPQQKAGKKNDSDLSKVMENSTNGTNGGKRISGENDGVRKSQAVGMLVDGSRAKRGDEQQKRLKIEVRVGTKKQASKMVIDESKLSEKGSERDVKVPCSPSKVVMKKMTVVPKIESMNGRERRKIDASPKNGTSHTVADKKVSSKSIKTREQKVERLQQARFGNCQDPVSNDMSLFNNYPANVSSAHTPVINSRGISGIEQSVLDVQRMSKSGKPTHVVISYEVVLHCMFRDSRMTRKLDMYTVPRTGYDIKVKIERDFMIPRAFQGDLTYLGKNMDDTTSISQIGLKAGEKMEMTYLCEGELLEVAYALKWFKFLAKIGRDHYLSIYKGLPLDYSTTVVQGLNECIPGRLASELFVPTGDKIKYANRIYFLQQNGLDHMLDVYEKIMWVPWRTLHFTFKFIEIDCIAILATLSSSPESRKAVIKADGHGFVLQSFLRVPVSKSPHLVDTSGSSGNPEHNNFILKKLLTTAVYFFLNFRDCTEIHMDICSKCIAVNQMVAITHCSSFSIKNAQDCLCVLACCMHSPDAHKFLCYDTIVEGIVDCVDIHIERGECSSSHLTLLQYYAQVTLAQIVMSSGYYMPMKIMEKVLYLMLEFLRNTQPSDVHSLKLERHHTSSWSLFFPYMNVLLSPIAIVEPRSNKVEEEIRLLLQGCSLETMLFVVQVMCSRDLHTVRRDLLDENLLAYVFCLPPNLPRRLQPQARDMCTLLRKDSVKPVPLPKLNIMVRAKLAAMNVGLTKVMKKGARELKYELTSCWSSSSPPTTLWQTKQHHANLRKRGTTKTLT